MTEPRLSRFPLAFACLLVATICGWAAFVLPWRAWTTFAIVTTALGLAHLVTGGLALAGSRRRAAAWRVQSVVALTWLGWLTWNLVTSASYIAALYGGLGRGVAVALGLVWTIAAFFTVPLSLWGLASTGGIRRDRRSGGAAVLGLALLVGGALWSRGAGAARPTLGRDERTPTAIASAIGHAVPISRPARPADAPPLATAPASVCERSPEQGGATVLASYLRREGEAAVVESACIQGDDLATVVAALAMRLHDDALGGPIALDVVTATHRLEHLAPVADGLLLRPGLDGACEGTRCLAPWQLLARDAFTVHTPIPVIPDLRFGFEPAMLRRALEVEPSSAVEGLVRIETASFVVDDEGELHALRRLRADGPTLATPALQRAKDDAEAYIASAIGEDGRFEYKRDPFTGIASYRGFSLARQAGTTLVVCEVAEDRRRAKEIATAALAMLVSTARVHGRLAALAYPREKNVRFIGLGDTALATIALLSCRDLVGPRFDGDIDRMTRFLLAMQREDGGFHPKFDLKTGAPVPGPDPLYAVGQAVFALTLLETLVAEDRPDVEVGLAAHDDVRTAVDRAMTYTAEDYWQGFARDFFWMEENWHCLAARASLGHHRHDGYERFCLDYVQYKTRLILAEEDEVDPDLVGGYGFGNVLLPHNTGAAGFGEAMSAAIAVARARDLDTSAHEAALARALQFLLHHQWDEVNSFACAGPRPVAGAFSENMGSPVIRIDFVQHALAALGHGGRVLGLLP